MKKKKEQKELPDEKIRNIDNAADRVDSALAHDHSFRGNLKIDRREM